MARMNLFSLILFLSVTAVSCTRERERDTEPEVEIPEETAEPAGGRAEPATLSEGFAAPESALYDPEQDVYFVSNINGKPTDPDDNGYISRIAPSDDRMEERWIDGAREDVTLSAPKGMILVGEELWVADIDTVRRFDRKSGGQRGAIAVPEALFLNDLATGSDGPVYLSDSGMEGGTEGSGERGMDSIYRISRQGKVEKIASGPDLHRPNGLLVENDALWVVTFESNELYRLSNGKKTGLTQLPNGSLDGLVRLDDGSFVVSSWEANGIYRGIPSGTFELIIENVNSPADIGFDSKRRLLLVPHLMENVVSLHPVEK